jgi:hypothetical protein
MHTNFADESACLTADNVRNEVVTIHKSQEVLEMLSFPHVHIFAIVSLKNTCTTNNPSCIYSTPDTNFHCMASAILLLFLQ